ncbi:P-type phospholipid transporter [Mycena venus]|uniref:P-type phospholipid transporter n=1 Tax=Mycena venus TaxID=2733690 RepID=A0A8H6XMX0_9AGAR|nr:P-type phospholipid transporter [Mycena venus]
MPLSLKAKLETWAAALKAYDQEDFETALKLFSRIPKSSIILTNMGLIHAALGEHEAAVERFIQATLRDSYLAVAYFQCGVSNFLLGRYDLAFRDFREALQHLRDNQTIDYEQIGLNFRLYAAEVLFNRGLCLIHLNQLDEGITDLEIARELKVTKDHEIIGDAIRRRGKGYTVFSIPRGICYRPSEMKLANTASKDYMGEARLIAAIDLHDTTTGFSGPERLNIGRSASSEEQRAREPPTRPIIPRSASMNDATRAAPSMITREDD